MNPVDLVHEVLIFIEAHLCEPLEVTRVTEKSGFSSWHFQRVFRAMTGVSIAEYIRLRRLTVACEELRRGGKIIEVALEVGYDSHEGFTRAFTKVYGISPSSFQKTKARMQIYFAPLHLADLRQVKDLSSMECTRRDTFHRFFATRYVDECSILMRNSTQNKMIPDLWKTMTEAKHEILPLLEPSFFGICESLPSSGDGLDSFEVIRYHVGLPVKEGFCIPSSYQPVVLSEGAYAVFSKKCSLDNLSTIYRYIYGQWLVKKKKKIRQSCDIETFIPTGVLNEYLITIFLPIE